MPCHVAIIAAFSGGSQPSNVADSRRVLRVAANQHVCTRAHNMHATCYVSAPVCTPSRPFRPSLCSKESPYTSSAKRWLDKFRNQTLDFSRSPHTGANLIEV